MGLFYIICLKWRTVLYIFFTHFLETSKTRKQESVRGIRKWTFINVQNENPKDFL
jgi:hypothetical protein